MPSPRNTSPSTGKLRLSPTRIGTFLACRVMYKYEYLDKIGRFYHKARAGQSFGSTLHQALHDFHVAGGAEVEGPEALAQRAMENWRSGGYEDAVQEAKYQEMAVSLLHNYHEGEQQRAGTTRVFLAEKMIKWDMGGFVLTGRIDRIDEHLVDGALEIVDYKSGRMGVTAEDVENALAMCVYQFILKRNYPERRVMATIHALRSGDSATVELSDEQIADWDYRLREVGEQILSSDWESARPVYLEDVCPGCDFLSVCERYWRQQKRLGLDAD